MLFIRKSDDRGRSSYDWLKSLHTFSFANYYDPKFMGYGDLRVINEDTVQGGKGFGKHPHHDMEIISYVVEGELEHQDSMGTGSVIKPGEIQIMSAGTGVTHSEFNHSKTNPLHFLQIWIIPEKEGLKARYQQIAIPKSENKFILIGSHDGNSASVTIHQDVALYVAYMKQDKILDYSFKEGRSGWVQLIKGKIMINDSMVSAGDGVAIAEEDKIVIQCLADAELLLFDIL